MNKAAVISRYHVYTRDPRHEGLTVLAAAGIPHGERGALAQRAGIPVIFADVVDIERAETDVRGPDGEAVDLPDTTLAAYRLFLSRQEAPLKRLRFLLPTGEVEVQGEYFRTEETSQVWREAPVPSVKPLTSPDLGQALGPLMGLRREEILGVTWVEPGGAPVVAVLLAGLSALRRARVGAAVAAWVRAHGDAGSGPFRTALMSPEGSSPLSDGHVRLVGERFEPLGMDGTVAACALLAHWNRTPRQGSLTAEVGDGLKEIARLSVWIEGAVGAPERLSIAGHVRGGEAVDPASLT